MGPRVEAGGECSYSTRAVAEIFGVTGSTIKRWTDSGKLKCFRTLGGHRRYPASCILEFIESFASRSASPQPRGSLSQQVIGVRAKDVQLVKKDYHLLCEVFCATALKGDVENLAKLVKLYVSKLDIPLVVVYEEVVSKAIEKIKNLARSEKLNAGQEENAIETILKSFSRLS